VGGTTVSYTYRADSLRASKAISGGATTNYTWDVGASLPVILQDGAYSYVYGLGLISQTDGAGSQTYMLPDGTKSNETLTDGGGTVSRSYKYDVFGSVRSTSGTASTEFRYAAEQYDDTVGLIYLRARYYDPTTGRFLSKDPAGGKLSSPVTQNKYVYAGNNPVNGGDPTGMVTNAEMNSWMANVPVTYWTPSSGYTSSFSSYSAAFNARSSAPVPVPDGGSGGGSVPTRLSNSELTLACPTGLYWFALEWNPCTGTQNELEEAYWSWLPLPMGGGKVHLTKTLMKEMGLIADEAISQFKKGSIRREFPTQFLQSTLEEIERKAATGDHWANTALKLLFRGKYDK